jgi:hypothetical protein
LVAGRGLGGGGYEIRGRALEELAEAGKELFLEASAVLAIE